MPRDRANSGTDMAGNSDYLNGLIINAALRGVAVTWPSAHYIALFTADPADVLANETTYTGYARQNVTNGWGAASGTPKQTSNSGAATFPPNGGASPVTFTHWGVADASSAGNLLLSGPLSASKTASPGDSPTVGIGDLIYKPDVV